MLFLGELVEPHWSDYGLAGLVIGALFAALFVIVKWLIGHIDRQADRHREERSEWRTQHDEVAKRVEKATEQIGLGIRELVETVKTKGM